MEVKETMKLSKEVLTNEEGILNLGEIETHKMDQALMVGTF
jgi:hypothetical protein